METDTDRKTGYRQGNSLVIEKQSAYMDTVYRQRKNRHTGKQPTNAYNILNMEIDYSQINRLQTGKESRDRETVYNDSNECTCCRL